MQQDYLSTSLPLRPSRFALSAHHWNGCIYLVTDPRMPWHSTLRAIRCAVLGGVTVVQLREKGRSFDEICARATQLRDLLRPHGVPLIINDHVDVAAAVRAHGVHLGASDCDPEGARNLLGPDAVIGISVSSTQELEKHGIEHCDYVSASPVFPTLTKEDGAPPMGLRELGRLRRACTIPLVAIGGVHEQTARLLAAIGVDGVCTVSAVLGAASPTDAARALAKAFRETHRGRP